MRDIILKLGRAFTKAAIKEKIVPYLQLLKEAGVGENEIRYLVEHNLSFYKDFMPPAWKKAAVQELRQYAPYLNHVNDDMIALVVEAITDEVPWFARVVTRDKKGWLLNELAYFKKDLEANEENKHDSRSN